MSVKSALLEMHILRKQTSKRTETAAFTKYHGRNLYIRANFDYSSELSAAPLASEQEAPGSTQERQPGAGQTAHIRTEAPKERLNLPSWAPKFPHDCRDKPPRLDDAQNLVAAALWRIQHALPPLLLARPPSGLSSGRAH